MARINTVVREQLTGELLAGYKANGVSDEEIAEKYEVSRDVIKRLRKRYGVGRLAGEAWQKRRLKKQPTCCKNPHCKKVVARYRKGLCNACYEHQRLTGEERIPKRTWGCNKGYICKRCKQKLAYAKRLCTSCYVWQRVHGTKRPSYKWATECTVCQRPNVSLSHGRCHTCYCYWQKRKVDRTPGMIAKIAPLGWCECGKPVAHQSIPLQMSTVERCLTVIEDYDLCETCYKLEFS